MVARKGLLSRRVSHATSRRRVLDPSDASEFLQFAILKHERDVWHGLAVDARNGWSDELRKSLKDLYKVDIPPESLERTDSKVPLRPWEELKGGVECENGNVCVDSGQGGTVPMLKVRATSASSTNPNVLYYLYGAWIQTNFEASVNELIGLSSGGGYTVGTADGSVSFMLRLSKAMDCTVYCIDYSKAPEHKFPLQLQQALSGWSHLTIALGIDPSQICLAGDSAGGSLSLGLTLFLRDHRNPLPAGAILICPWLELTTTLPSNDVNQPHDYLTTPFGPLKPSFESQYCATDEQLFHPYLSPVFDRGTLPRSFKVLDQIGGADTLMDDGLVWGLQQQAEKGATVRIERYEEEVHDFQVFDSPEFLSGVAIDRMGVFFTALFAVTDTGEGCFTFRPGSALDSEGESCDGLKLLESEFEKVGKDKALARQWIDKTVEVKLTAAGDV